MEVLARFCIDYFCKNALSAVCLSSANRAQRFGACGLLRERAAWWVLELDVGERSSVGFRACSGNSGFGLLRRRSGQQGSCWSRVRAHRDAPGRVRLVVCDDGVHDGGHDADDDGREKRAAEAGDVEPHVEHAVAEPRGQVQHGGVHHQVKDAERQARDG